MKNFINYLFCCWFTIHSGRGLLKKNEFINRDFVLRSLCLFILMLFINMIYFFSIIIYITDFVFLLTFVSCFLLLYYQVYKKGKYYKIFSIYRSYNLKKMRIIGFIFIAITIFSFISWMEERNK